MYKANTAIRNENTEQFRKYHCILFAKFLFLQPQTQWHFECEIYAFIETIVHIFDVLIFEKWLTYLYSVGMLGIQNPKPKKVNVSKIENPMLEQLRNH